MTSMVECPITIE